MEKTKISWTDNTFNPWIGCTKVSSGCANCYAEYAQAIRYKRVVWGKGQPRKKTGTPQWKAVEKWNDEAQQNGTRTKVFCASLADVFDREVADEWRDEVFDLIGETPHLDWQLLTKRPDKAVEYAAKTNWPANAWIGTTVENQNEVWRAELIKQIPAAVRFLSMEPLLSQVTVDLTGIDWVIVGGESGPDCRSVQKPWVEDIKVQCDNAKVPFFFKQWGGVRPDSNGHLLDGVEHHNFPTPKADRVTKNVLITDIIPTVNIARNPSNEPKLM